MKNYLALFAQGADYRYKGESSTDYMMSEVAVKQIKAVSPKAKFIFILRNPIDRAYSHYQWLKGMGFEKASFQQSFLLDNGRALGQLNSTAVGTTSYYQEGLYTHWLSAYFQTFGKENIYLITSEDLRQAPLATVNGCFQFLGLPPVFSLQEIKANDTKQVGRAGLYRWSRTVASGQSQTFLKSIYRRVFPDALRIVWRRWFLQVVEKTAGAPKNKPDSSSLDIAQRNWVASFYREDVATLKKLTGLPLHQWPDFL